MTLTPRHLLLVCAISLAGVAAVALGNEASPVATPAPKVAESVPHGKFVRVVKIMRRQTERADRLERVLRHSEVYENTLTLAQLVYPGANAHLADSIMFCESGRRAWAKNARSSAGGRAQYLDTTWASTPEGQAGLSRFDPVAAVFAIFRHLQNSGNDAGPWTESRPCWGGRP